MDAITAWKLSKYGDLSRPLFSPNVEKYGPEITLFKQWMRINIWC